MPCGRCTPALPKPIPANVAASSICSRAWSSDRSRTARTRLAATISIARAAHTSLIGLAPW